VEYGLLMPKMIGEENLWNIFISILKISFLLHIVIWKLQWKTLSFSVWCRMHEERGKTARKTKPDAGMGDGWNKIQVRNKPCHLFWHCLIIRAKLLLDFAADRKGCLILLRISISNLIYPIFNIFCMNYKCYVIAMYFD